MRLFFLFLALLCGSSYADVIYGKFEPVGIVTTAKPKLSWKVTPTGGGKIGTVNLELNRRPVEAMYSGDSASVVYNPQEPLPDGIYRVVCRVTIEGQVTVRQDWSFEVNTSGQNSQSIAGMAAFDAVNEIRRELGLPAYKFDQRVAKAAQAHSRYMALNKECGHVESPNRPGFTGKLPWDRIQAFGYNGVCYEGACFSQGDPGDAIRLLFNAPYHRIPFLQPGSPDAGAGVYSGGVTVNFVLSQESGVSFSPAAGQANVPLSWDGNEMPNPLRVHGIQGGVGYPIVFGYFSPTMDGIRVTGATLIGPDGGAVPFYLNTPDNDDQLRNACFLIPKAPLSASSTYTVTVRGATVRGVKFDRTWSFTTA